MLTLLALLAPCLAGSGTVTDPYQRVVARALERAQGELLAATSFIVDHSKWEDPWMVTTEHYQVRTTASYALASEIAVNLEFMHGEFVKLLGQGNAPPGKLPVWIFPTLAAYNAFGQENGAEHSSLLGSFYSSQHAEGPVVTYQIGNKTQLGMWITHSAVHQYLEHAFGDLAPVWVSEGLAGYFALFWDWAYGARELERIQKAKLFVPLERIVREPLQAYAGKPNERFTELGMLFQFLLHSCEATKDGSDAPDAGGTFREFLRAAVRGQETSTTEFAQSFADAHALLEEDFKAFAFPR